MDHTFPKQVDDYGEGLDKDVAELKKQSEQVTAVSEPDWARLKRNYVYKPLIHLRLV